MNYLIILLAFFSVFVSGDLGDRLTFNAEVYNSIPLTSQDAMDDWQPLGDGSCIPYLGIPYMSKDVDYPDSHHPLIPYYTPGGYLTGIGIEHFGTPADNMEDFWVGPNGAGNYRMVVTFREPDQVCSDATLYEVIGTQLVINQDSTSYWIPINDTGATAANFTTGSCIQGMGYHWSYDLAGAPVMTWLKANLLPIVPMYNAGQLSAFFFATPNVQTPWPLGDWEGPIPDILMCKNWCSSKCDFDTWFWSTLHFYVSDPALDNCPSKIYCPPSAAPKY